MHENRIIKWNRDRGLLEGGFDIGHELKMLSEEAREFYYATDYPEMLAEYSDFIFVMVGTKAKYFSDVQVSHVAFSMHVDEWNKLDEWMTRQVDEMQDLLLVKHRVLGRGKYADLQDDLNMAMYLVIKNNEYKSDQKLNGKVIKSEDQHDPADLIRKVLNESQGTETY